MIITDGAFISRPFSDYQLIDLRLDSQTGASASLSFTANTILLSRPGDVPRGDTPRGGIAETGDYEPGDVGTLFMDDVDVFHPARFEHILLTGIPPGIHVFRARVVGFFTLNSGNVTLTVEAGGVEPTLSGGLRSAGTTFKKVKA